MFLSGVYEIKTPFKLVNSLDAENLTLISLNQSMEMIMHKNHIADFLLVFTDKQYCNI